ncbi:hypothetical protein BT63DRAFT_423769 [Microthyrium microscopicum]|uniref:Uncharacterized protein n=1 Tax=Microthyrium microscopicum TaxID=703497 RepID=A0A6A6UED1_9PEZI|nr:hypothetical protein BT63DRAFT_423769 [Microthyrium microscopicum]
MMCKLGKCERKNNDLAEEPGTGVTASQPQQGSACLVLSCHDFQGWYCLVTAWTTAVRLCGNLWAWQERREAVVRIKTNQG